MQVILKQRDIEQALALYLREQGINLSNKNLSVSWTAGRKESGITAEIDIEDSPEISKAKALPVMSQKTGAAPADAAVGTDDEGSPFDNATVVESAEAEQVIQAAAKAAGVSRASLFS